MFKFFLLFIPLVGWSTSASAHGAHIDYQAVQAVNINAVYEGGQPMANAQVTVYAPNDPSTPWSTGTTDEQGRFTFTPDADQPGNWEVKVRQAGHGDIVSVPVGETAAEAGGQTASDSYTPAQKVLLGAAGAWGFLGTALFFARKKTD